jgi:hypothetical protein
MRRARLTARLFLNDRDVGTVQVKGWDDSWGFGEFLPGEGFSRFAPRFGAWSLLMHADDGSDDPAHGRLSAAAAEELREVEQEIDRLHAKLFLVGPQEWRPVSQLNIDGPLIEWKENHPVEGGQGAA